MSNPVEAAERRLGPLTVLRIAKTINTADDATKKKIAEAAESLELWCGYLVVTAVVLEGLIYVVPFFVNLAQRLIDLGEFIASVLVALGVFGEIRFAGICSHVLKLRLAETEIGLTDATKELARLKTPRHTFVIGNEQRITSLLSPFSGTNFDCAFSRYSGEQAKFWLALLPTLTNAGWVPLDFGSTTDIQNFTFGEGTPWYGPVAASNVEIFVDAASLPTLGPPAAALINALLALGIVVSGQSFVTYSKNKNAIHIAIGEKT